MSRLKEEKCEDIRKMFKQTGSIRATAKLVHVSRKAVKRVLSGLPCKASKAILRPSKLDDYKAKIKYLVCEKRLSAVRVLEEIRDLGYSGGYSILKDYVSIVRPKPFRRPTQPIDHPPGHEGQMDWSEEQVIIGGKQQTIHIGSFVLCFSRWLYFDFFSNETMERVVSLHEAAFKELGAVPEIITYDNMTTVGMHVGPGEVWINPAFKRFAESYGFAIVILPPGAKERHGKIERPFGYIKHNFLAGREFHDMDDLVARGHNWRANQANVRIHGTLRERPVDRLIREKPYLKPLPNHLADNVYKQVERLIHTDFCVAIDTNRYSASPRLIGRQAKVRLYRTHLEIWVAADNDALDCKHAYLEGKHQRQVLPEHESLYKAMTGQRRLLEDAFLRIGEVANSYYEGLIKERKAAAGYHLKRIIQYAERYGRDVVAGALTYAAKYDTFSADAVLRIIKGKNPKPGKSSLNANVPENVRQFLKAYSVEKQELKNYDELIKNKDNDAD